MQLKTTITLLRWFRHVHLYHHDSDGRYEVFFPNIINKHVSFREVYGLVRPEKSLIKRAYYGYKELARMETFIQVYRTQVTRPSLLTTMKSIRFILPARYREEFAGDITEIHNSLKNEGHFKIYVYFFLLLTIINVCWVSFRFKWNEYFGIARRSTKNGE